MAPVGVSCLAGQFCGTQGPALIRTIDVFSLGLSSALRITCQSERTNQQGGTFQVSRNLIFFFFLGPVTKVCFVSSNRVLAFSSGGQPRAIAYVVLETSGVLSKQ